VAGLEAGGDVMARMARYLTRRNARPETATAGKQRRRPGAWQVGRVGGGGGREVGGGGETAT
jgi:hypothetical protein